MISSRVSVEICSEIQKKSSGNSFTKSYDILRNLGIWHINPDFFPFNYFLRNSSVNFLKKSSSWKKFHGKSQENLYHNAIRNFKRKSQRSCWWPVSIKCWQNPFEISEGTLKEFFAGTLKSVTQNLKS